MHCNLCGLPLDQPVYRSPGDLSVTSICELYSFRIEVYYCPRCTHLQTPQLTDLEAYYDHSFKMLVDTEEEDHLYEVAGDQRVYRYPHQAKTLLAKVLLPAGARALDYGCAKGTTLRHVLAQRPDVQAHLFDVSRSYIPFWEKFLPPENWAVYEPKEDWASYFDLVTSFFVLEHIAHPVSTLTAVRKLLRPQGQVYFILPNVYANICDFVVADHVNHFSAASLRYAFAAAELDLVEIDQRSHHNAFIVIARNGGPQEPGLPTSADRERFQARADEMAAYWRTFADRIHNFESGHKPEPSAIYGAGVYGALTAITLADRSKVVCFVDRNRHLQGRTFLEKPILAPEQLPPEVRVIYVGLNPAIAKAEMKKLPSWVGRPLTYYYL
jgi:2-polyprenyl-3-methyl-5-hydroxy-6-metoxy-1,4-benzoquinol methylase